MRPLAFGRLLRVWHHKNTQELQAKAGSAWSINLTLGGRAALLSTDRNRCQAEFINGSLRVKFRELHCCITAASRHDAAERRPALPETK